MAKIITKVTNNLKIINNISMRVVALPSMQKVHRGARLDLGRSKTIAELAGAVIDSAIRGEIDKELSVMRRGENIGINRRRILAAGRYVNRQSSRIYQSFYGARMRLAPSTSTDEKSGGDGFHSDIIHERQTSVTHTSFEQHNTRIVGQDGASTRLREESARQIAEQVFNRVERKLRTDRERLGIF